MRSASSLRSPIVWLTAAAAAIRFPTLAVQSFSGDEGVTRALMHMPLGDMLSALSQSESTPPLYYLLAWGWSQVFGEGELGLRSLSALLGTAAVPVVYAAACELASRRVAVMAGALAAAGPLLVWYSQEARAYALLALLASLSFLWFVRALAGRPRALGWWALSSALALCTHYYAAFPVGLEALWLVVAAGRHRRQAAVAPAAVAATAAALAPLALEQRSTGNFARFIADIPLGRRLIEVPKKFLLGEQGTPGDYGPLAEALLVPAAGLALLGAVLLLARTGPPERRAMVAPAAVGAAAILVPAAMALAGADYFAAYLVIAAWPLAAIVAAGGFAASAAGRLGLAAGAALVAIMLTVSLSTAVSPTLQRPDFRGAADALGDAARPRLIVATPDNSLAPMNAYRGDLRPAGDRPPPAAEIVLLGMSSRDQSFRRRAGGCVRLPAHFVQAHRYEGPRFTLVRLRAPAPARLTPSDLAALRLGDAPPAVAVQSPAGR